MDILLSDDERFLEARFDAPQRTLSWALVGGGFGVHRSVVWHFVRRQELPLGVDPQALCEERLRARGIEDAVGLLTARHLRPYARADASESLVHASAVVTVGLGNALRAGDAPWQAERIGTINVLCRVSEPLTDSALLEALALVAEARTAALIESAVPSTQSGAVATGTGTDCIVVACPCVGEPARYAGKHTATGAVIGRSVLEATRNATRRWLAETRFT
jgi:adenosylcobinamide amidohydrolase